MIATTRPAEARLGPLDDSGIFHGVLRAVLLLMALALPLHLPFALPTVQEHKVIGWRVSVAPGAESEVVRVTQTGWGPAMAGLQAGDVLLAINGHPATLHAAELVRSRAMAGDTIALAVLRDGERLDLRVPVEAGSQSYAAYQWYRVLLGLMAWAIGFGLVIWRGDRISDVVLGAALLLVGPVLLVVDLPSGGMLSDTANYVWKLQAAAYRIAFPALLLCFLTLRSAPPRPLRSGWFWAGVWIALFATLAIVTRGFTSPLAWAVNGWEREFRAWAGLIFELLALGGVLVIRQQFTKLPNVMRWLAYGILMVLLVGVPLSVVTLVMEEQTFVVELLRQMKTVVLGLFLAAAGLYLLMWSDHKAGDWEQRRQIATSASALLTAVYGFAVAGTAAIVHSALGPAPHRAEWLLFAAIFVATLIFSPVLRWTRDLVDRRVFSRWVELETRAQTLIAHAAAELQPERVSASIGRELPLLLGVEDARLIVAEELVESWGEEQARKLAVAPREELRRRVGASEPGSRFVHVPVYRPDGVLIAAIRIQLAEDQMELEPPEQTVLRTISQGIASALRNADAHLRLQGIQAELAEADRIAALGALAGGLAHEVKNPLASLKMGLYLLERETGGNEKLGRIQHDVRRIDDLVSSLLRSTQTTGASAVPEPVDVREVAERCVAEVRPTAEEQGVTVMEKYPRGPVLTLGSESQVRIIISNLLSNACDAVDAGDTVEIRLEQESGHVELEVRDSGPGIPEEHYNQIFDLSFSTKPEGFGLGLALARRETERLGGEISAAPADPTGSILRVRLPGANLGHPMLPRTIA